MAHKYARVKDIPFNGMAQQVLWKVSPPVTYRPIGEKPKKTSYVITSATNAMFSGPETYIFPANRKGEVINWTELPGSYRGGLDHEQAISNVGSYQSWED